MKGIGDLFQQAQSMKRAVEELNSEMSKARVTGESGAGMVKVTINGSYEALSAQIDPTVLAGLSEDERTMVEDLVAAAVTDASRRLREFQKDQMASLTRGVNLPPDLKSLL
ncbi:MAG: YbaB/EbfC family nucleoid-associated protein [Gammaproteobacteria bacterium]|nr:YbaB/EbfC family nucleoid-associated protein [Gammaproteobacteria bacterium]